MRINELFTTGAVPWEWMIDSNYEASANFSVGGEAYRFYSYEVDGDQSTWEIIFQAVSRGDHRFGITGTGNAATVMTTVVDIMTDFLKTRPYINSIQFSAKEPSRRTLYIKMVRRLLPSWHMSNSNDNRDFIVTRPGSTNESNLAAVPITELFTNRSVPWRWEQNTADLAIADFIVAGEAYSFYARADDYYSAEWHIMFRAENKGNDGYKITGSGNSAIVMATIVDILREFFKSRSAISTLEFSAEEPSRRSLYTKMVQRLLPTWKLTKGEEPGDFKLINPNRIVRDDE